MGHDDERKRKAPSSTPENDSGMDHQQPQPHQQDVEQETTDNQAIAPITKEGERPQKKFYRQRAHCNPLSHNDAFNYPVNPDRMDWTAEYYPKFANQTLDPKDLQPTVLDIGCGFGGLTMALGEILPPTTMIMGLEIRAKVTEYVRLRIVAARRDQDTHHNVSVMRTNSQKFLPNYYRKHSMDKLFFCFPDPHFKRKNHPRRIVSDRLLSEYAYLLKYEGILYCITDVLELHEWHVSKCDAHPLFQALTQEEMDQDPCVQAMIIKTEEGQKVERNGGQKYYAVYRRKSKQEETETARINASNFFGSNSDAKE